MKKMQLSKIQQAASSCSADVLDPADPLLPQTDLVTVRRATACRKDQQPSHKSVPASFCVFVPALQKVFDLLLKGSPLPERKKFLLSCVFANQKKSPDGCGFGKEEAPP